MSLLALSGTSPLSREGRRSSNGMFQYRRGTTTPLTTPYPSWGKTSLAFLPLVHSSSTHGCGLSLQTDGHLFFSPFCIEAQESLPAHSPLHPPLILVGEVTPTATHPVPTRPPPRQPALVLGSSLPILEEGECLCTSSLPTPPSQKVPHTHRSQHRMTFSGTLEQG